MKHLVFEPWIGGLYEKGLQDGKRVLVLGHSHHCTEHPNCEFRNKCTSSVSGCRECRTKCAHMDEIQEEFPNECEEKGLLLTTKTEIKQFSEGIDEHASYVNFSNFMCEYFRYSTKEFWDRIAFYNYVQYFLSKPDARIDCITKDEENDLAFEEMLTCCPTLPDVIIAWGTVGKHLYNKYRVDGKSEEYLFKTSEEYLFKIKVQGKIVDVLNSRHPSSIFHPFEDGGKLKKYMDFYFL